MRFRLKVNGVAVCISCVFVAMGAMLALWSSAGMTFPGDDVYESDPEVVAQFSLPKIEDREPLSATTSSTVLFPPPLEYLLRVKGDPAVGAGQRSVRVPVLIYHHVRPIQRSFSAKDRLYTVTPEAFRAQMIALVKSGYSTITPEELYLALTEGRLLPAKPILLTFDDGFRDQFENAWPVLREFGLHATFFLISQMDKRGNLTDAMVREMAKDPLLTIGAHSRHHSHIAQLSSVARQSEIVGSKSDLERLLDRPVDFFAYPFGSWSPAVAREVEQAEFRMGFGIGLGSVHTTSSLYRLRRIRVLDGEDAVALADAFSR
jgi:peptidoglycan/xylan/chitin deacetylase (PgdA/CDA1 family)